MTGEEKQGVLFGEEDNKKPDVIHKKSELISNRKLGEKRPYIIKSPDEIEGLLRYYDLGDVEMMREMKKDVIPTIDSEKKVKTIVNIPDSIIACEICEDMTAEQLKENNLEEVQKGTVRLGYDAGDFRIVCEHHKPKLEKHEIKVEDHEMTEYTKWINDH
jgi:hypothetical protein